MKFSEGNGHGKGLVQRTPVREGYVIYHAGSPAPPPEEVPNALDYLLTKDLSENPTIRVLGALPIVREGNTIRIHLWYEVQS
jgi:hypothetical protein